MAKKTQWQGQLSMVECNSDQQSSVSMEMHQKQATIASQCFSNNKCKGPGSSFNSGQAQVQGCNANNQNYSGSKVQHGDKLRKSQASTRKITKVSVQGQAC